MRPIKFRFWNQKEKKIYGSYTLQEIVSTGGYHSDGEWLQFTGLLDKNGKEIYEGDIIQFVEKRRGTWKVEFRPPSFLPVEVRVGETASDWGWGAEDKEIIGNIYENPDILNKDSSRPTEGV